MESRFDRCTGKPRNAVFGTGESLCSFCAHACRDKCSWAESFTPVEGWEAEENKNGYFVIACPEFEKEKLASRVPERLDEEGCVNLLEAMTSVMKDDYVKLPKSRQAIERYIRDPKNREFFFFADPNDIILKLRQEAREKDMERRKKHEHASNA